MKIKRLPYDTQNHRKTADPYYTSRKHKNLRAQAYHRDKGVCKECERNGKVKQLQLHTTKETRHMMAFGDHIIPREAGGKDELDNYQTLCKPCHDAKSNEDKEYYR